MRRNVPFSTEKQERTSRQLGNAAMMEDTTFIAQQYHSILNASLCSYEYTLSYPVHVLPHPYIKNPSYLIPAEKKNSFFSCFTQPCMQRRCSTVKSQSCQRTKYKIRILMSSVANLAHLFLFFFFVFYHSLL